MASEARRVLSGLDLVDVTREILERAGRIHTAGRLGTLDAIHVSTALAAEDRPDVVVGYDAGLLAAA